MAITQHKSRELRNSIKVQADINRNQDPELYDFFLNYEGKQGKLIRDILREALVKKPADDNK